MTYVLDQAAGVVFRIVEQAVGFRLEPVARPDPGEASAGRLVDLGDHMEIVPDRRTLTPAEAMREVTR